MAYTIDDIRTFVVKKTDDSNFNNLVLIHPAITYSETKDGNTTKYDIPALYYTGGTVKFTLERTYLNDEFFNDITLGYLNKLNNNDMLSDLKTFVKDSRYFIGVVNNEILGLYSKNSAYNTELANVYRYMYINFGGVSYNEYLNKVEKFDTSYGNLPAQKDIDGIYNLYSIEAFRFYASYLVDKIPTIAMKKKAIGLLVKVFANEAEIGGKKYKASINTKLINLTLAENVQSVVGGTAKNNTFSFYRNSSDTTKLGGVHVLYDNKVYDFIVGTDNTALYGPLLAKNGVLFKLNSDNKSMTAYDERDTQTALFVDDNSIGTLYINDTPNTDFANLKYDDKVAKPLADAIINECKSENVGTTKAPVEISNDFKKKVVEVINQNFKNEDKWFALKYVQCSMLSGTTYQTMFNGVDTSNIDDDTIKKSVKYFLCKQNIPEKDSNLLYDVKSQGEYSVEITKHPIFFQVMYGYGWNRTKNALKKAQEMTDVYPHDSQGTIGFTYEYEDGKLVKKSQDPQDVKYYSPYRFGAIGVNDEEINGGEMVFRLAYLLSGGKNAGHDAMVITYAFFQEDFLESILPNVQDASTLSQPDYQKAVNYVKSYLNIYEPIYTPEDQEEREASSDPDNVNGSQNQGEGFESNVIIETNVDHSDGTTDEKIQANGSIQNIGGGSNGNADISTSNGRLPSIPAADRQSQVGKIEGTPIEGRAYGRYETEADFFEKLKVTDPYVFKKITDKIRYFDPAFHSMSPEGFNARLTFLHQCTRQGHTISTADTGEFATPASNLAFGRMPVCVLRLGDFINTRVIINNMNINYLNGDGMQWDLNPEGAGVQPMFAKVNLGITILGGQSLAGPISRLQNAVSFDYYANASVYDNRADRLQKISSANKSVNLSGTTLKDKTKGGKIYTQYTYHMDHVWTPSSSSTFINPTQDNMIEEMATSESQVSQLVKAEELSAETSKENTASAFMSNSVQNLKTQEEEARRRAAEKKAQEAANNKKDGNGGSGSNGSSGTSGTTESKDSKVITGKVDMNAPFMYYHLNSTGTITITNEKKEGWTRVTKGQMLYLPSDKLDVKTMYKFAARYYKNKLFTYYQNARSGKRVKKTLSYDAIFQRASYKPLTYMIGFTIQTIWKKSLYKDSYYNVEIHLEPLILEELKKYFGNYCKYPKNSDTPRKDPVSTRYSVVATLTFVDMYDEKGILEFANKDVTTI